MAIQDTAEFRQRAAAELLAYLRSPENPNRWRILEPQDLPHLERLSQAAQIPILLHRVNLTSLTEEVRQVGYVLPLPPAPS